MARFGQPLDLAHGVVGKIANRAGGEGRQAREPRGLVAGERPAQHGKDVVFKAGDFPAFGDRDLAAPRHDALEGREADEGVAAHLLAALDRLQQKALPLMPGGAQKGRDRGFQVGGQGAANGHQGVLFGEREKLLAAGLDGMAGGAFTGSSVTAGNASPGASLASEAVRQSMSDPEPIPRPGRNRAIQRQILIRCRVVPAGLTHHPGVA